MAEAIRLAIESVRAGGGPFGAVVVQDGEVIGRGANRVTAANDPTAHAEIVAMRSACDALGSFQLKGCEIYTSCEPCPMCMGAIYWARPARVHYASTRADAASAGFDDARIYEELSNPVGERSIPMLPLMREEALAAFAEWSRKTDKVPY
jgi:guanine deaminase